MDLDPTPDQRELQAMISRFAEDRFPIDVVRSWGRPGGFSRSRWQELAELGTFGITIPEDRGGTGLRPIDEVLVHEALGAALVPGPVVTASLAARVIDGVTDGSVVPTIVDASPSGTLLVQHLRDADVLVVLDADGVYAIDTDGIDAHESTRPTDPTTPVSVVTRLGEGRVVAGADDSATLRMLGSLLSSAQLVGISEAATSLAVDYAKEREQFGRAIGSFQGIKHLLADNYVRTEVARSALWSAGVLVDEPDAGDVERAVAGVRVLAARAALENAKTCIQVHGGMGFTWEVDAHLYLKRAIVLQAAFGSPEHSADLVAATLTN